MSVIHHPHDHFFRSAMTNLKVAKEFFEHHLPKAVQEKLDLNTLELQPGTYINKALENTASDVLYKLNYCHKLDWAYLYLLVEHRSSIKHLAPFELWQHIFSIWGEIVKKYGNTSRNKKFRLPLIIPLLFHNGPGKYTGAQDIRELIAAPKDLIESVFLSPIQLIDLHDIKDEDLQERKRAGIMQLCMKHAYDKEMLKSIQRTLELIKFSWHNGEENLATDALKYSISEGRTADPKQLVKILKAGLIEEESTMGTLADYFTEKNKDEWLPLVKDMWRQSGRQEGESTLVIHLLRSKFKTIPERYLKQVEQASQKDLLKWADRILESKLLEEIFEV
jgi:hypothetical protein